MNIYLYSFIFWYFGVIFDTTMLYLIADIFMLVSIVFYHVMSISQHLISSRYHSKCTAHWMTHIYNILWKNLDVFLNDLEAFSIYVRSLLAYPPFSSFLSSLSPTSASPHVLLKGGLNCMLFNRYPRYRVFFHPASNFFEYRVKSNPSVGFRFFLMRQKCILDYWLPPHGARSAWC